jgi:hypothetical protein
MKQLIMYTCDICTLKFNYVELRNIAFRWYIFLLTPKKKKGRSELLEKSPVTPPDVIHDNEREKGAVAPVEPYLLYL